MSEFFSEIARSSIFGNHRYVVQRDIAGWAVANLSLSERDRMHLDRLRSEYTQLAGLLTSSPVRLDVAYGDGEIESVATGIWRMGHRKFLSGKYSEPVTIVLENAARDGAFYEIMFEEEARAQQIGEINYRWVHGGGASCGEELKRQIEHKQISLCICDTDRIAPGAPISEILRAAERVGGSMIFVGRVFGTPGREIENFIPLSIASKYMDYKKSAVLSRIIRLFEAQSEVVSGDCFWLYFDIKKGVNGADVLRICSSRDIIEWVCRKYRVSEDSLEDVDISGFGDSILSRFMSDNVSKAEFSRFMREKYWSSHFSGWFSPILWFLSARRSSRAF
ncbi:hypothetical protein [Amorphus sp. MBR-141]